MDIFADKRKALFDCLDNASAELKGTTLDQSKRKKYPSYPLGNSESNGTVMMYRDNSKVVRDSSNIKSLAHLQGKESIFKKPELPIGKCLRPNIIPDYQMNPHRWKKYTLEETDISDNSNAAAALAFLNEIDVRKATVETIQDDESRAHKIEFKKSSEIKRTIRKIETSNLADAELEKAKFKGAKLVMPEYVVGQGPIKKKSKRTPVKLSNGPAAGTLKLSHLAENDEN